MREPIKTTPLLDLSGPEHDLHLSAHRIESVESVDRSRHWLDVTPPSWARSEVGTFDGQFWCALTVAEVLRRLGDVR